MRKKNNKSADNKKKSNNKVARLYKRKNARVKKALSFTTPNSTKNA